MSDLRHTFDKSYWRAVKQKVDGQDFFTHFYAALTTSPRVTAMFAHTDMRFQAKLLNESLIHASRFSTTFHADSYLQAVARHHAHDQLNVAPELYDLWLACMLDTVKRFDPLYDEEVDTAWRVVLAPAIAYMRSHYARPPGAPGSDPDPKP